MFYEACNWSHDEECSEWKNIYNPNRNSASHEGMTIHIVVLVLMIACTYMLIQFSYLLYSILFYVCIFFPERCEPKKQHQKACEEAFWLSLKIKKQIYTWRRKDNYQEWKIDYQNYKFHLLRPFCLKKKYSLVFMCNIDMFTFLLSW